MKILYWQGGQRICVFSNFPSMGEYLPLEWLKFGALYALHPTLAADRKINRLLMLRFPPEMAEPGGRHAAFDPVRLQAHLRRGWS